MKGLEYWCYVECLFGKSDNSCGNIGQRNASESALRQSLRLNEDYIPAYLWLGGLLGELGRLPEQAQVLQQAMALDPLNELLAIDFAGNLTSRGDHAAGKDLLKGLIALRPDSATLLRIIAGYSMKTGDLVGFISPAKGI